MRDLKNVGKGHDVQHLQWKKPDFRSDGNGNVFISKLSIVKLAT